MKKLLLIAIFTLLLCAISANAAPNFNIIQDHVNLTGTHQQTLSSSFLVNNTNNTKHINIDFTGYTLASGANQLSITSLNNITNLANKTSQTATFSVVIPNQQRPGLYTGTLTAASNLSDTDTVTINVNVTPAYSVSTVSEINLGSATLNNTYTKTFNIENTGNDDITNAFFEFSKIGFNLKSNKTNFTLPFNKTETIQFNITIPADSSTGNVTLGYVKLVSAELNTKLFDIKADVGGGLEINDLDVFLTTRKDESGSDLDVYDGRKLNFGDENAGPGSELRFNFNIENTFKEENNVDIKDITVAVTIEGIDDGSDIEEKSEEFDLDSNKNTDVDVTVKIPLSVEADVYDIIIEVAGEDENGNEHKAQMNLKIDVNKESRDVIISEASLFPDKVKCAGSSTLTATIKNLGKHIEEHTQLAIANEALGISFMRINIYLEEDPFNPDNEFTKKLVISIGKNTTAGTYPIIVKSYLQEEILWETKTANLVVEACDQVEEKKEAEPEVIKEITETEPVEAVKKAEEEKTKGGEIPVLAPTTTTEVSFAKRPAFWFAVAILNIIVIAAVAFLVVKLVGKK